MAEVACPSCGGIGCSICQHRGVVHEIRADALRKAIEVFTAQARAATEKERKEKAEEQGGKKRSLMFGFNNPKEVLREYFKNK